MTTNQMIKYSLWLVSIFSGIFLLSKLENTLIFFPERYPAGNWNPNSIRPEDAWITTEDGEKIHGWFLTSPTPTPKAVVLYSHGNGGNITGLADYLKLLSTNLNLTVLAYDYRGYGKSSGLPSIKGILKDANAATTWLAKRAGVLESDIVQIGRSLGGGVAIQNAITFNAKALVLENTFSSISAMGKRIYPWLPVSLLLSQDLDSLGAIRSYKGSLLIIHGDRDEIIPKDMGEDLFQVANQPKRFVNIQGGRHNDFPPPLYFREVEEFIKGL